jgi:5-methylthioadenosine/S-adenosylhomocysteine deaminase
LRRVIAGGTVITCDDQSQVFADGLVAWQDNRILYVGPRAGYSHADDEEKLDARGGYILPGLVNLHTHTTMTALRGLVDDLPAEAWLPQALKIESHLTPDDRYWSSLAGATELLRRGVTFIADRGSGMLRSSQALWESGIRAVVAQTLTDEGATSGWNDSEELLARWGAKPQGRIFAGLGPHATDTCSDMLLTKVRDRMEELGALVFIHMAQSRPEVKAAIRRGDKGCAHLLHRLGLLRPELVAAHCIYLEPEETDLLATTATRVAHCPVSNAKVEGVVARCWQLWRAGVVLGLGTDCAACNNAMDLWFDLKFATLFHKTEAIDPTALPARVALSWVTSAAAACVNMSDQIGSLRLGARADIIILRGDVPNAMPAPDPYSHLVYSVSGGDVETVVVDGRLLLSRGSFLNLDTERISHEMARIRAKLT